MRNGLGIVLALSLMIFAFANVSAQITIDTSIAAKNLVGEHLLGKRVKVNNIRYYGSDRALGKFIDNASDPLIGEGVMLSTGDVFNAIGPNSISKKGTDLSRRGDRALQYIGRGPTFDAAVLEFDFKAQLDFISFNFFFASEEYTEFVGSTFNDVFAFYISGPGINGTKNLAVLPEKNTPITVNTVNHITNTVNYMDNDVFGKHGQTLRGKEEQLDQYLFNTFEFDGMTTLLRAETEVIPGQIYHIRIAIADVGDGIYDSAVFLEGKSFSSYPSDPIKRAETMLAESNEYRRRNQPSTLGLPPPVELQPTDGEKDMIEPKLLAAPEAPAYDLKNLALVKGNPWKFEFGFDRFALTDQHEGTLDTVASYLKANPKARLRIEGHTDNIGTAPYNQKLSQQRANSVQRYLTEKGIDPTRLETAHYGYDRPLQSNSGESGRAQNRRVEIILLKN